MAKKEEIKVKVNTEEPKEKGKKAEEMPIHFNLFGTGLFFSLTRQAFSCF